MYVYFIRSICLTIEIKVPRNSHTQHLLCRRHQWLFTTISLFDPATNTHYAKLYFSVLRLEKKADVKWALEVAQPHAGIDNSIMGELIVFMKNRDVSLNKKLE